MKKRILVFFLFIIASAFLIQAFAQFTPEEIAQRPQWEEFLQTAKIIDQQQLKSREAVTEPWKLTLEKDGITRFALWKNPEGRQKGYLEGWKWEIAAYRLDKYLELNMVPPTVERKFQENRGSCQLWVEYEMTLKQKYENNVKVVSYKVFPFNRATYLHRAFDNLIANEDRHQGNVLITKDWRLILIDHSRSFRTSKKFIKDLIYTEKHKEGPKEMKELPRAFVEKLKNMDFDMMKEIVGEYLTDEEIEAVLIRRDLILEWLDKRIKKLGEDQVLY